MSAPAGVNFLIDGLPARQRNRLLKRCEPVDLAFDTLLCEIAQPYEFLYFPYTGVISLLVTVGDHRPLEMGLIGNEGMLGATLALGVDAAPLRAVVQGAGSAARIAVGEFERTLHDCLALRPLLNRYLYVLNSQLAQSAACTHFHQVEPRLARWLLMTHDRVTGDRFHLTHQFLADMLGVQRSAITIAAGVLQERNLIRYTRGEITVLDRGGLEAASCECYETIRAADSRLLTSKGAASARDSR